MVDHFRNFEGFAPEGRYESCSRILRTTAEILKRYKIQRIVLGDQEVIEIDRDFGY